MEGLMTRVKIRPEWKRSLPVVALLSTYPHWKVTMSADPDPVFSFAIEPDRVIPREDGSFWGNWLDKREADAHEVRRRFFAVKTPEQALAFFRRFGPWQVNGVKTPEQASAHFRRFGPWKVNGKLWAKDADPISFSQLIKRRRAWQDALVSKDKGDNLSFGAEFQERQQIWVVACEDVVACVRTTVILDRASRWRWCAREDCTAPPFECGNHGREYHDDACASRQRKRNQRDNQRKRRTQKTKRGNSDGSV
jgi:hypothetical protein